MPKSVFVFQAVAMGIAKNVSKSTCKILWYILGIAEKFNYLSIDQKSMANILNLSLKTVNSGLNELVKYNVIQKMPKPDDNRRNDYFINPLGIWKGGSVERKSRLDQLESEKIDVSMFGLKENYKIHELVPVGLENESIKALQPNQDFDTEIKAIEIKPVLQPNNVIQPIKRKKKPKTKAIDVAQSEMPFWNEVVKPAL